VRAAECVCAVPKSSLKYTRLKPGRGAPILTLCKDMLLSSIAVLIGLAVWLAWSIFAPKKAQARDESGVIVPWHSDYKQLRIEYHQSVDKSVQPPRH